MFVTTGAAGQAETVEVAIGRLGVWMPVKLHPEIGEPVDRTWTVTFLRVRA